MAVFDQIERFLRVSSFWLLYLFTRKNISASARKSRIYETKIRQ